MVFCHLIVKTLLLFLFLDGWFIRDKPIFFFRNKCSVFLLQNSGNLTILNNVRQGRILFVSVFPLIKIPFFFCPPFLLVIRYFSHLYTPRLDLFVTYTFYYSVPPKCLSLDT